MTALQLFQWKETALMERTLKHVCLLAALIGMLAVATAARAGSINITLTQSTLSGTAGSTLTFAATLTNISSSTVFLNGDSSTTVNPGLVVSDNPFLNNAPLSLAAGASSGPFDIFTVTIAAGTTPGMYSLNTFTILGGPDSLTLNPVGSTNFTVDVLSPVPEPGTLVLVGSGLVVLAIKHRFKRRAIGDDSGAVESPRNLHGVGPTHQRQLGYGVRKVAL